MMPMVSIGSISINRVAHGINADKYMDKQIAEQIISCFERGGKILIFGNGGSLADASHWAAEFHGIGPVIALNDAAKITSIGNDNHFNNIFLVQICDLGEEGDIAIGLSSSGKSQNVVNGLAAANYKKMETIEWPRKGKTTAEVQEYQYHLLHEVYLAVKQSYSSKP